MAKIDRVQEVSTDLLKPYENNAKVHSEEQVQKIAESIKEFGFLNPCLIDKEMRIIAGHGRVMAAKMLGMNKVPCLYVEGLTDVQRRAYILADNRLTEMGEWDWDMVGEELESLRDDDFEIRLTGFDVPDTGDWFEERERYDRKREEGNEEYNDFLDKFEIKKTTDDCYTPDAIYEAVADWVAHEYNFKREQFVRPFYPGGDYQKEKYEDDAVVVDNPPFSILSEILRFYEENNVRFFLFAPTLTLFAASELQITYIPTKCSVTYENGAKVNTSFITNLDDCRLRTSGKLSAAIEKAEKENNNTKTLPSYEYPSHVVTAPRAGRWSENDVDIRIGFDQAVRIGALDKQKDQGKAIYGGGLLVSDSVAEIAEAADKAADRKAADKAADRKAADSAGDMVWELSERELDIVRSLK